MMDFPASPAVGATYAPGNGLGYIWDGVAWNLLPSAAGDVDLLGFSIKGVNLLNGAGIKGRRSPIINGNFDIWQRQLTQSTNGYGSDDRFSNLHNGSTKTHSQQAFVPGQTAVPGNPKFFSRTAVTSVANVANYVIKNHYIEDVNTFAGKTVTAVFWAKAAAAQNMAFDIRQYFGTGGSPSADVTAIGAQLIPLTTNWQKFALLISIPPIAGKTLGSNNDHSLIPTFWFDAGANYNARTGNLGQASGTFDIARFDLIEGDVRLEADPHTNELFDETLNKCLRYYEKSYDYGLFPGSITQAGAKQAVAINLADFYDYGYTPFKVRKRALPTIGSWAAVTGTSLALYDYSAGANAGTFALGFASETMFRAFCGNSGMTATHAVGFCWTADAELAG